MNLFKKDKDLILKLTNLFLFIWLLGSLIILYTSIVEITLPKPLMNYEEYKNTNCIYYKNVSEEECKNKYDDYHNNYKNFNKKDSYKQQKILFTAIGSVLIVSATLYALNRKEKK